MSKRIVQITVSVPEEVANQFDELAKIEKRTRGQFFQDLVHFYKSEREWLELRLYASRKMDELGIKEEDVDRIIHEFRAEREAGRISGGLTDEEIEKFIREAREN